MQEVADVVRWRSPMPEASEDGLGAVEDDDYRNPSVLMVTKTADDGQILESENELLFVSTTSDKAKFALMLNQAGVHDSLDGYTLRPARNNSSRTLARSSERWPMRWRHDAHQG